jgi:hypothetical protein
MPETTFFGHPNPLLLEHHVGLKLVAWDHNQQYEIWWKWNEKGMLTEPIPDS